MHNLVRLSAVSAILSVCCATLSAAQSLGLSYDTKGRLAAGFSNDVPGADLFFFGDATVHLSLDRSPLGFELGVFGLASTGDTPHETYGTFVWDFAPQARLLVGVPRPAYDSFAVSAMDAMLPPLGVARTPITRSRATSGAMYDGYLPYGLRFETTADRFRFAASIDTVPNRDLTIASLGFGVPIGNAVLETAIEVSDGAETEVSGKVQVSGPIGPVQTGLGLYAPGQAGLPSTLEAFASFQPAEKITIAGAVQIAIGSNDRPVAAVSMRYAVSPAVDVSLGALRDADATAGYAAFLDWKF